MSGFGSNHGVFGAPTTAFNGGNFGTTTNSGGSGFLSSNSHNSTGIHPPAMQRHPYPPPPPPPLQFGASTTMTGFGTSQMPQQPHPQPFGISQLPPPQQQQQPAVMFGSSPNVVVGVVGGGGFGTTPTTTNQFYNSSSNSTSNTMTFGSSSSTQPHTPFASSTQNVSSFVNNTPLDSSFSSTMPSNSSTPQRPQFTPFGAPTTMTTTTVPTFSTSASILTSDATTQLRPFEFPSTVQPSHSTVFPTATSSMTMTTTVPNPFGFGNAPQNIPSQPSSNNAVTFGMSSNVMTTNTPFGTSTTTGTGSINFASPQNNSTVSHTPFAAQYTSNSPVPNPFGRTTTATPFHMNQTVSDGMSDDDVPVAPATAIVASNPFGGGTPAAPVIMDSNKANELAKLQAKIAAKKKKIEEKKLRESAAAVGTTVNGTSTSLRATATPFAPSTLSAAPTTSATDLDTSAVAQRNAIRFAESNDAITRSQLPSDLLDQQSAELIAAQTALRNAGGSGGREHLENAVSLVGTCIYMCPDEELLRRQREGDIQLLERPDAQIHPSSWTLRQTTVKRFRRSAADYKLDVPEWIRPPDILEKVCGYLEEWVMERDRQGPDPRYKNLPPPPLDVYQFVWDRTRMVRKDFILQNFVGTGGLVDARAVRCHERIARWHCLCEHQLSHIDEYVMNQSQQNMQELGQTMKTLNQFYDDSLGRALCEVPDEAGHETRTNLDGLAHGCGAESVQGQSPTDYDGTAMVNDTSHVTNRLIGAHAVASLHHGTAEPEMRGLYILLTMDNDRGLEVNKYASRLYEERPEVYHTKPVQLALSIYKAKIDRNYVKFFAILRSPSTPYLFACLMFKHVAAMRRYAISLMSKTYGGKHKDGSNIYDEYQLRHLTSLLCFEDDDEARSACRHYNITVKTKGDGSDVVYWKGTLFREPKDPEKGTVIPLRPRKMIKTIEGKLHGATRLAVCRGQLSGTESYLSPAALEFLLARSNSETNSTREIANQNEYLRNMRDAVRQQQVESLEAQQKEIIERQKRDEAQRLAELEMRRKNEEEMKRRIHLEEQQQRQAHLQREKEKLEKEQQELKLRLEIEEKRRVEEQLLLRQEAERQKKAEQERQEALRLQRECQIREEAERNRRAEEERERQRALEMERIRKEREEEVQRQQEKQRLLDVLQAQELERQRREAERLHKLEQLRKQSNAAHKIATWIWRIIRGQNRTIACRINDTLSTLESRNRSRNAFMPFQTMKQIPLWEYDEYSNRLAASLASMITCNQSSLNSLLASNICAHFDAEKKHKNEATILLTLAFIFPMGGSVQEQQICEMIHAWLQSRFTYNEVFDHRGILYNVRIVIYDNINPPSAMSTCDAAIFVVPPPLADEADNRLIDIKSLSTYIDDDVPRMAIAFFDRCDSDRIRANNAVLSDALSGSYKSISLVGNVGTSASALEESALDCIEKARNLFAADDIQTINRTSVERIIYRCVSSALWMENFESRDDIGRCAATMIQAIIKELEIARLLVEPFASTWSLKAFALSTDAVPIVADYFGTGSHLPVDWASMEQYTLIDNAFMEYFNLLKGPITTSIHQLIADAPYSVRANCQILMDQQFFKRCLQAALQWKMNKDEGGLNCRYVYLPAGAIEDVIHRSITLFYKNQADEMKLYSIPSQERVETIALGHSDVPELIDRPPQETPSTTSKVSATKRLRFSDSFEPSNAKYQGSTPILDSQTKSSSFVSTGSKRSRTIPKVNEQDVVSMPKHMLDSLSFTEKLHNLLHGNDSFDLMIGKSFFLSTALLDAPPLITELDDTTRQR